MLRRTTNSLIAYTRGDRCQSVKAGYILVVDDDLATRQMLVSYFNEQHVEVSAASGQAELKRHLEATDPSMILLGLCAGQDGNGLDVLKEVRTYSDVPIIAMGHHVDKSDRAVGLELGADDYIVKPVNLRELLARVRALLRRQQMGAVAKMRDPGRGGFRFGGWQLERRRRRLVDPNGVEVMLRKSEYALLLAFLGAPQRVLTREQLLQGSRVHQDVFDRSVDVQVMRLRRKLNIDSRAPSIILTQRGVGYVFALEVRPF